MAQHVYTLLFHSMYIHFKLILLSESVQKSECSNLLLSKNQYVPVLSKTCVYKTTVCIKHSHFCGCTADKQCSTHTGKTIFFLLFIQITDINVGCSVTIQNVEISIFSIDMHQYLFKCFFNSFTF